MIKICSICLQELDHGKFGANKFGKNQKRSTCKKCTNLSNKERTKIRYERYRPAKESGELKRNYGIDMNQFNQIFNDQGGVCLICKSSDPGRKSSKRMCVDHCHTTGKIRGLLCSVCNTIVGFIENKNIKFNDDLRKYMTKVEMIKMEII